MDLDFSCFDATKPWSIGTPKFEDGDVLSEAAHSLSSAWGSKGQVR